MTLDAIPFLTDVSIAVDAIEEKARDTEPGAVVSFQGVVRPDQTNRGLIQGLFYAVYSSMANEEMERISDEIRLKWPETCWVAQHRFGFIPVGETSLFLVVSSPERDDAFLVCQYILDQMKSRIPLWKKEVYSDRTSRWSCDQRETLLIADSVLMFPPS